MVPQRGGNVHVMAIPLLDGGVPEGFVVLVHDLSFVERRDATVRKFIFWAFGFLALAGSVTTLVAARLSWRGWSNELRGLLTGAAPSPEFRPFLRDVRDLVERLASERETDGEGGLWTPQRLKNTLTPTPPRRARRHRRQPRTLHSREDSRRHREGGPSGERPRHGPGADHASVLGSLGGPRKRLGRS